jgi:hypothetical protein
VDITYEGHLATSFLFYLKEFVRLWLNRVVPISPHISQNGLHLVQFSIRVHEHQLTAGLGRRDQTVHALRKYFHKHLRADHQTGMVGNIVIHHHQGDLISLAGAYRLHHLFLVVQEDIHQGFDQGAVIITHK